MGVREFDGELDAEPVVTEFNGTLDGEPKKEGFFAGVVSGLRDVGKRIPATTAGTTLAEGLDTPVDTRLMGDFVPPDRSNIASKETGGMPMRADRVETAKAQLRANPEVARKLAASDSALAPVAKKVAEQNDRRTVGQKTGLSDARLAPSTLPATRDDVVADVELGTMPGYEQPAAGQLSDALVAGTKEAYYGAKATGNAYFGNDQDLGQAVADMAAAGRDVQQTAADLSFSNKLKAVGDTGFFDTLSKLPEYAGIFASEPLAAAKSVVRSLPNAAVSLPVTLAGRAIGGVLGAAAGAPTGPGAIASGAAGAMALGGVANAIIETGPAIRDAINAKTNNAAETMTADELAAYISQHPEVITEARAIGAKRGMTIGAIEGLVTMGAGRLASAPERAAADAARGALVKAGVDVADAAAVKAALQVPANQLAAKLAADGAAKGFSKAGGAARWAGAGTAETLGAGAGEAGAQYAAGQKYSGGDVIMEMAGELGAAPVTTAASKAVEVGMSGYRGLTGAAPAAVAPVANPQEAAPSAYPTRPATPLEQSPAEVVADTAAYHAMPQGESAEEVLPPAGATAPGAEAVVAPAEAPGVATAPPVVDTGIPSAVPETDAKAEADLAAIGKNQADLLEMRQTATEPAVIAEIDHLLAGLAQERGATQALMGKKREEVDTTIDPVRGFVTEQRRTNTPAAQAFVRQFEAGAITPAEVQGLIAQQQAAAQTNEADSRIAAAAAQATTPNMTPPPSQESRKQRMLADFLAMKANQAQRAQAAQLADNEAGQFSPVRIEQNVNGHQVVTAPAAIGEQVWAALKAAGIMAPRIINNAREMSFRLGLTAKPEVVQQIAAQFSAPRVNEQLFTEEQSAFPDVTGTTAPIQGDMNVVTPAQEIQAQAQESQESPAGLASLPIDEVSAGVQSVLQTSAPTISVGAADGTIKQAPAHTVSARVVVPGKFKGKVSKVESAVAEALAGLFKKKIVWFAAENTDQAGKVTTNATGGYVFAKAQPGTVFMNVNGSEGAIAIVMHELTHLLEAQFPKVYQVIRNKIEADFKAHPEQRKKFEVYYGDAGASKEDYLREAVADAMANQARNPKFWANVFTRIALKHGKAESKTIIAKLRDSVMNMIGQAVQALTDRPGFQNHVTDLQGIAQAFETAAASYLEGVRTNAGADYAGIDNEGAGLALTDRGGNPDAAVFDGVQLASKRKSDNGHTITKSGVYVGAPAGMTAGKLGALRQRLERIAREGEVGKMWYEESSKAILDISEGDKGLAEKLAGLLAIYSPQATVSGNTSMGLKALYQFMAGRPIEARFAVQNAKATEWMNGTMGEEDAMQIKTGNFFKNLMRKIDEDRYGFDKQGATIDMWMARMFGYGSKAIGSEARYLFAERETTLLADKLGWEPQQVQAAIWVAIKSRVESIADKAREIGIKKDWLVRKVIKTKGKENISWPPKDGPSREKYEALILKMALATEADPSGLLKSSYNFGTALKERIGQISWEAMPGRSTGFLPGIFNAPLEQQAEYLAAMDRALRDETGQDLIAKKLGLPVFSTAFGPSAWQMDVGAGAQTTVAIATERDQGNKKISVAAPAKKLINAYAAIRGLILRQEAVVWHFPIFSASKKDANGIQLDIGRDPTHNETVALYNAIHEVSGREDWAPAYVPGVGWRVLNFSDVPNTEFHKLVGEAVEKHTDLTLNKARTFQSDGDYIFNDWEKAPDGSGYKEWIGNGQDTELGARGTGRSDLQGWVERELRPRTERVNKEFAEKYGWDVKRSPARPDGAGSDSVRKSNARNVYGRQQEGSVQVEGLHFSNEKRTALDSNRYGQGLPGAEGQRLGRESATSEQRQRIHFYVNEGSGVAAESGVGYHAHAVMLSNLYDTKADTLRLFNLAALKYKDPNDQFNYVEQQAMKRGFDGVYVREAQGDQGVAVLLGSHNVPVDYLGMGKQTTEVAPPMAPKSDTKIAFEAQQQSVMSNNSLPGGEMSGADWKRMMPKLMPEIDVSHLDDETRYYKDQLVERPQLSTVRAQPETPEFKKWFGGSVVTEDGKPGGEPLRVYHGTNADIEQFTKSKDGGFHFGTQAAAEARMEDGFSGRGREGLNSMPVYLAIKNPKRVEDGTSDWHEEIAQAKREGHDGLVYENEWESPGEDSYVAFEPTQIKSASGNNGQFDAANPDIRFSAERLSEAFEPKLREHFKATNPQIIKLSDSTPASLQLFGWSDLPVVVQPGVIDKMHFDHGMTIPQMAKLPFLLQRPLMIFGDNKNQSLVLVGEHLKEGKIALTAVRPIKGTSTTGRQDVTVVVTGYAPQNGWDEVAKRLMRGELVYRDSKQIVPASVSAFISSAQKKYAQVSGRLLPRELLRGRGASVLERAYNVLGQSDLVKLENEIWPEGAKFSGSRILGDSGRQYTPEQQQLHAQTGREVNPKTIRERLSKWATKKWIQGVFDQFDPIKGVDATAYRLTRQSKGATGAFEALMNSGKLSIEDGTYNADTTGGVMQEVFFPLGRETTDFLYWIAGHRAERLAAEGKERLFSPANIAAAKSLGTGQTEFDYVLPSGQATRDRAVIYKDSLRKFNAFSKNVMDMAEQSGLIDGASRHLWEHEFYVPFYRVIENKEDNTVRGMNVKKGVVRQEAFKKLKGGTEGLNDLLSNTLMNWAHLIDAAAKNRAAKASLDAAVAMGAAQRVAKDAAEYAASNGALLHPETKNTVWYSDKGEKVKFVVEDAALLTAISSLDYVGLTGPLWSALTLPKHWLTLGVTASPFFKIRNLIRDSVQAIGTSNLSYNVVGNLWAGAQLTDHARPEYASALAGGGLIRFGTMLEGNEARRTRRLIRDGAKESYILDTPGKLEAFGRMVTRIWDNKAVDAYNELGNRGEEINRMALYDQLRKAGVSHGEAAFQARDLMDFSMQGSFESVRILTQLVPFMNARLQGMYKLGKSMKHDRAKFSAVLGAVAVASLGLLMAYQDDDDWKKREDWDRDTYWWFKIGGIAFRIPKPFEIGAIATLAERSAELMFSNEMNGKRFLKVTSNLVWSQLSMDPVPQAVKPILDIYSNYDGFTKRPIETMAMEKLDPQHRYTSSTSMPARGLSKAIGGELSPVQIDHLVKGYFGWLGAFVIGGADMAVRAASNEPTKPALDYWKFATGGMVQELDSAGSRYVSQMYEQAKELEAAHGTYAAMRKEAGQMQGEARTDKLAAADEYKADHLDELRKYNGVENVKRSMSRFNERIRLIERSNLEPDVKRERIVAIQKEKDKIARKVF